MDANTFGTILVIGIAIISLALLVMWILSLVWVYTDSRDRGKYAALWLLIAFFTWPFGVLVYYLSRNQEVRL